MKNEYIQVRISEQEKSELTEMSAKLDKPISQIVRESIRGALAAWEKSINPASAVLDEKPELAVAE